MKTLKIKTGLKRWIYWVCPNCNVANGDQDIEGNVPDTVKCTNYTCNREYKVDDAIKPDPIPEIPLTHTQGHLSIESNMKGQLDCDFGIQIAHDGRIWICIDDQAFIRFKPNQN